MLRRAVGYVYINTSLIRSNPEYEIDRAARHVSRGLGRLVRQWRDGGGEMPLMASLINKGTMFEPDWELVDTDIGKLVKATDLTGFVSHNSIEVDRITHIPHPDDQLLFRLHVNLNLKRLRELPVELAVKRAEWQAYAKAKTFLDKEFGLDG